MKRPKHYRDMDGLQKLDYILMIIQIAAVVIGCIAFILGLLSGEIEIPQWLIAP